MFESNACRNLRRHGNVAAINEKCIVISVTITVSVIVNVRSLRSSSMVVCRRRIKRNMVGIATLRNKGRQDGHQSET